MCVCVCVCDSFPRTRALFSVALKYHCPFIQSVAPTYFLPSLILGENESFVVDAFVLNLFASHIATSIYIYMCVCMCVCV